METNASHFALGPILSQMEEEGRLSLMGDFYCRNFFPFGNQIGVHSLRNCGFISRIPSSSIIANNDHKILNISWLLMFWIVIKPLRVSRYHNLTSSSLIDPRNIKSYLMLCSWGHIFYRKKLHIINNKLFS